MYLIRSLNEFFYIGIRRMIIIYLYSKYRPLQLTFNNFFITNYPYRIEIIILSVYLIM
jgi:hypothetical protein